MFIKGARKIEKNRFFPFYSKKQQKGKYLAIIGLGSNIENEKNRFLALFRKIMQDRRLQILQTSPFLINKAFGFEKQKDFTNAVMMISTSLHARALLKVLFFYEFKFRRKRTFKNAPRTLDLDLLYFSKKVRKDEYCIVPHQGVNDRISVILPLGLLR
ncbi:2-amino-4-hydroxy-6-hydroxymethyldihydropteridine diphosphokinase [Campylobacter insulaenigrae]|uniref:2-amino-4-hydroxy-6-hydroxymethyldihydropteridine pyrophosphokinase n=2 Tax=Campylobacter insulaenigrae TaxID=260714 RepID=A0A0A8H0B8_9BACT|nr:2-amino-4-hydroxy-6-hydroxymethyldihydropteridine diphosphokinase [Campylobacter insulaenigrae]AJC87225.1 6-hydroxymethyl-7,8-dihydropterin pyrophosphokinase [Campylobacter insulaenigrae NCTC 12927]TWO25959.1 2-amino-4-hydroxy-6-hydroxymethyldihydropteridine diphosphokinase [Campylobacter insulaenigrae]VEH93065.1 2-amino-4-hydroxy-6-hydroxymethyldihydropteridinepyrophosphokinase [Campylobacter insulaenigrae]